MLFNITTRGRNCIGWRGAIRPICPLSLTERDILYYLNKRKTPTTTKEINRGAYGGFIFSTKYTLDELARLVRYDFIRKV